MYSIGSLNAARHFGSFRRLEPIFYWAGEQQFYKSLIPPSARLLADGIVHF